jgi:Zn-finger nucleic acid-binding protein
MELSGDRADCPQCRGMWVTEEALAERLRLVADDPRDAELRFEQAPAQIYPRRCAVCGAPLDHVGLQGVLVDRCAHGHGLWFDPGELERAMLSASGEIAPEPRYDTTPGPRLDLRPKPEGWALIPPRATKYDRDMRGWGGLLAVALQMLTDRAGR